MITPAASVVSQTGAVAVLQRQLVHGAQSDSLVCVLGLLNKGIDH